jgi:hypothetical protein
VEAKYNEPLRHHSLGDAFVDDGATPGGHAGGTKRASSVPPLPLSSIMFMPL